MIEAAAQVTCNEEPESWFCAVHCPVAVHVHCKDVQGWTCSGYRVWDKERAEPAAPSLLGSYISIHLTFMLGRLQPFMLREILILTLLTVATEFFVCLVLQYSTANTGSCLCCGSILCCIENLEMYSWSCWGFQSLYIVGSSAEVKFLMQPRNLGWKSQSIQFIFHTILVYEVCRVCVQQGRKFCPLLYGNGRSRRQNCSTSFFCYWGKYNVGFFFFLICLIGCCWLK